MSAWPTEDSELVVFHVPDMPKFELPHYTTSLDAAITLIPAGWTTDRCREAAADPLHRWAWYITDKDRYSTKVGIAPTPALAICIAALRARHNKETEPEGPDSHTAD